MKGVVFTTFFDHVRDRHDDDFLDDLIDEVSPPNGGSYTRVGTYPFDEMVQFVSAYAQITGEKLPVVLERFGHFCFGRWVQMVPQHFTRASSLFDALCSVDSFHKNEVYKLYPEAELPSFKPVLRTDTVLELEYQSCKPLADLAIGVIRAAAEHFDEEVRVGQRQEQKDGQQTVVICVERVAVYAE